jgi:hypothetical protein
MVSIVSLALPILIAAVLVFFASFLLHMLLPFHRADYRPLPAEDASMDALRSLAIPPGDYMVPCAGTPDAMKNPAFREKFARGPVVMMTVMKPGELSMGGSLVKWFIYCVVVGIFTAYVTSRAVGPSGSFNEVLRFAGVTSFTGYSLALWQNTIWYKRQWTTTLRYMVDGLIYSLLTGLAFAWMWPAA